MQALFPVASVEDTDTVRRIELPDSAGQGWIKPI
jgi:hypothetical protein